MTGTSPSKRTRIEPLRIRALLRASGCEPLFECRSGNDKLVLKALRHNRFRIGELRVGPDGLLRIGNRVEALALNDSKLGAIEVNGTVDGAAAVFDDE